jgi:acyl-ACP thioesterase
MSIAVCRSLFWVSYNFSLRERRKNSAEWNALWFCVTPNDNSQEPVAVAD